MRRLIWLFCFCCLFLVVAGCSKKYSGEQRYALTGKVSFNGEPIDLGSISFIPKAEGQRVSGGTIENGAYAVSEGQGANAGEYRVEIRWQKKTGKKVVTYRDDSGKVLEEEDVRAEGIPAEFNTQSTLTAVVGDDKTTFDFDLKSDEKIDRSLDAAVPARYRNR